MSNINLAIHGSHNASLCVFDESKILEYIEIERLINVKNSGLAMYKTPPKERAEFIARHLSKKLLNKYKVNTFNVVLPTYTHNGETDLSLHFPAKQRIHCPHHYAHIAGCFYQSPFQSAVGVSIDGGGDDGFFNIYFCNRKGGPVFLEKINIDLGVGYMHLAHYLKDIKYETDISVGNLVYAGKLMGLAPYGKVREEWLEYFTEYYHNTVPPDHPGFIIPMKMLFDKIGLSMEERLVGEVAYDLAATGQRAFEDIVIGYIKPHLDKNPKLPICFSGGCALNIILNTRLVKEFNREVFIGPNPNDSGLTVGAALAMIKPQKAYDCTYINSDLHDKDLLLTYLTETDYKSYQYTIEDLAQLLAKDKIIGVGRGKGENGPRALGNRSILCNPMNKDMKNILNAKVKNREWYRPFAPVVRLEDLTKYFEWNKEARWMSFSPKIKEEYKNVVPSVVHVDGSCRVQTVTKEQNKFLYDLLTEVEKITGIGMLLNTSFNVDSKPILSSVKDMLTILKSTELDGIVVEDALILKN